MSSPVSPTAAKSSQPSYPPISIIRGVAPIRVGEGTSFLLRRLHSLSGIVPIGAFLVEHIVSNATSIKGPTAYSNTVEFLNGLPFVFILELFGIWIPIAFHALYGFYIWYRGDSNVASYPWQGNWMYTLQRWTGGIAFVYIIWHTYTLRFTGVGLAHSPGASFGKVQVQLFNPPLLAFYVVGIVSAAWHFAYGIWLFAAKWGITMGERARQKFLVVCMGLFLLLSVLGIISIRGFRKYPLQRTDPQGAYEIQKGEEPPQE